MVNSLLSLILVATQVLSWNAAPLYLCLESDGTACLDFGPDTCGCCHEDASTPNSAENACHEHAGCSHADHARPAGSAADSQATASPCGCSHVQISDPQMAALGRMTFSAAELDVQAMLASPTYPGVCVTDSAVTHAPSLEPLPAAASPLALRADIVLRV